MLPIIRRLRVTDAGSLDSGSSHRHARGTRSLGRVFATVAVFLLSAAAAEAQPSFSKTFSPSTIGPGSVSRLQFDIQNGSGTPVTELAFVDNLPAGVSLADPVIATNSCAGTLTASPGSGTITLVDGALGATTSCSIVVSVTSSTAGTVTNTTGDLTSSAGNSGTATADLTVATDRPGFSKEFGETLVRPGQVTDLTFTIDYSAGTGNLFNISFTDVLPAGLEIDGAVPSSTTCMGSFTATPGTQTISLFSAFLVGGGTCTATVPVRVTGFGTFENLSSELNSSAGSSGRSTDALVSTAEELLILKEFVDDPVAAGGTVTLRFTIANFDRDGTITGVTFTDDLEAALAGLAAIDTPLADPCGAGSSLTGTSVLTLTGGSIPSGETCTFDVTLQVPVGAASGTYTNTTSQVTGSIGSEVNTGQPAQNDLVVSPVPTLTKTLSEEIVAGGDTVNVEFTLTNTSTTSSATDLSFTDNLTQFINGATPSNLPAAGFCGAGSTASIFTSGGDVLFNVAGANLAAGASCTFSFDLTLPANAPAGTFVNLTSRVNGTVDGQPVSGAPASDSLQVLAAPDLAKEFTDDPVLPGATAILEFTLTLDEEAPQGVTDIGFTDDLEATLTGLTAISLPADGFCGVGSQITGASLLTVSGASLAPGESCTFSVTVQVPATAGSGTYANTTSNVTGMVGAEPVTSNGAADDLVVAELSFTKEFIDDPAVPGSNVTLRFTISNDSPTADATGITFTDNLSTTLTGLMATTLPPTPCGGGSTITGTTLLVFTDGTLGPNESCSFDVGLTVPAVAAPGDYSNVTSNLSATIDGSPAELPPAADVLSIIQPLLLTKAFVDDPVTPGEDVVLEFTLTNGDPDDPLAGVSFTDDLDAVISGLEATSTPLVDPCGAGSQLTGTSVLSFTGGNLAGGASCTFQVTLSVPGSASSADSGFNTTSAPTGFSDGFAVMGDPATDTLELLFVDFSKSFDGPTVAGGMPMLTFTITNQGTDPVSQLAFSDDLDAVVPGLVAIDTPLQDICGDGSVIDGGGSLSFVGGSLDGGETCSFAVTLQVPAGTSAGTYSNTTSNLFSAGLVAADPATDDLMIEPAPTFTKTFSPDGIGEGLVATLTFVVDNSASAVAASNLSFVDTLPSGVVVAQAPNASSTCTGGTITATAGSGSISFSGGTVAAGSSCSVSVDVTAASAGTYVNTSSPLDSSSGPSGPATDTLTVVAAPGFAKMFAPDTTRVGDVSTLTFTIDNSTSSLAATSLDFTDTLPAGVVVATTPNASTTCTGGTITAPAGSGTISYSGGTVAANSTCTVSVDVTAAAPGEYLNTSSELTSSLGTSGPASDTLTVAPPPVFTKAFAPNPGSTEAPVTLVFTIDNSASTLPATALDFTDPLPTGVTVSTVPNASTTCTGGTITAVAGSGAISYTGGTVAAGSICTVSVDVEAAAPGDYVNTSGELTSSQGSSGTASDTLTVAAPPEFTKVFSPNPSVVDFDVILTFVIDNQANTIPATGLDFTDVLPAGLVVGTPANTVTSCTGGTITAVPGTDTVSYTGGTVAAGTTCDVRVDVNAASSGTYVNTSGELTSSLGSSGTASDTLEVVDPSEVSFTKTFGSMPVLPGGQVDLTFEIINDGPFEVTDLSFTDDLDAVLPGLVATGLPQSDICGSGSQLTGTSVIELTDGVVGAGESCIFTVTVDVPVDAADGVYTNETSSLTGDAIGVAVPVLPATDDLVVAYVDFTKEFTGEAGPGGTVSLTFTLVNLDPVNAITDLAFTDDLDAVLPGLVALGLPQSDVCGIGSQLTGESVITLTGGTLGGGESCAFTVDVAVPQDAPSGSFTNITSPLTGTVDGETVEGGAASAAQADLLVGESPIEIPTLSEWTLWLFAALLVGAATRRLRI